MQCTNCACQGVLATSLCVLLSARGFIEISHVQGNDGTGMSEVHTQELAAKISENERLHMKVD